MNDNQRVTDAEEAQAEALLNERPLLVLDDEEEVHDLGFIVDHHDDRHARMLEPWQRLETLDTDEPLETNRTGRLPKEADALREEAVPPDDYPVDFNVQHAAAERDEAEFATENRLLVDPNEEGLTTVLADADDVASDLDRDRDAESVDLLGHAPGIATGFGSSVPQDIGPDGFSVRDNPLVLPAGERDYPISSEPLSDEAMGLRDVDEMGTEADLDRLADQGARLEETPPPKPKPKRTRR